MYTLQDVKILIPALDPDVRLHSLLEELTQVGFKDIIIVNDGSSEQKKNIFEVAKERYHCVVLTHFVNFGKGRALKTGFNYILNEHPECLGVITVDSDGQHCVDDIKKCAQQLIADEKSIAIGCRNFSLKGIPFRSRFGNKMTCILMQYLCGVRISDTQTGLRGIPKQLLTEVIKVSGERFEYEMNMLLDAKKRGIPIEEFEIQTIYLENNKTSHFRVLTDSFMIYKILFKYAMSSGIAILVDFTIFSILIHFHFGILFATYVSRFFSSVFNFAINKNIVFQYKSGFLKSMFKYYILVIVMGYISAITISFCNSKIGIPVIIAKMLIESTLFFVNYYIQQTLVFKKRKMGSEL